MNPKQRLQLVKANGAAVLKAQPSDPLFKKWYAQAERALEEALGPDWQDLIIWQGWASAPSYNEDRARLQTALEALSLAETLLDASESAADTPRQTPEPAQGHEDRVSPGQLNIFIVHGHDEVSKLQLKNYLQNTLKLPEPIILHEQPNYGRTIIEKFEDYASSSTVAFVLLTPDDALAEDASSKHYRARQNVILELGYFLGTLGRASGRVVLLYKGTLDIPSDISGLVYIDISNGIEAAGEKIRRELSRFLGAR